MEIFLKIMRIIATIEIIAIIIIFRINGKINRKKKEENCNLKVKGRIVDRYTSNYDAYGASYRTFIVIEYEYNNEIYSTLRRISAFSKYKPYDIVEIMINPNEPSESRSLLMDEEIIEKRHTILDTVAELILIAPVICFIGVILFFAIGSLLDKLNIIQFD